MNKLTFEILNTEDFISDYNRREGRLPFQELHEQRVHEAYPYAGEFSPFEVADTFHLPVMTVRRIEREKGLYYRGNRNGR